MLEVADILRCHGPAYRQQHALLPSQQKVLEDLVRCRTPACGGQLYQCETCGELLYSYHSCGNRHCPKCHGQQTERWLQQQRARLLPCPFYFVTVTLPAELRALVYARQKALYSLLLQSAAAAVQKLAWDAKYVGGQLAILSVLHTWRRDLGDHPHAHLLVSGGGLARDGQSWVPAKHPAFLMPGYAVSKIFQGKFRTGLKKLGLLNQVPPELWQRPWKNVHLQHAGRGDKVLDYLGRYAFRIALSNSRLERFEKGQVTFGYRDRQTQEKKHLTLSAEEFIRRFLRHVLPKGFVKIRSYGLWSAANGPRLEKARALLSPPRPGTPADPGQLAPPTSESDAAPASPSLALCPQCKTGPLICIASLLPQRTERSQRWPQQTRAP